MKGCHIDAWYVGGFEVTRRGVPQCHYSGRARLRVGDGFVDGVAKLEMCRGERVHGVLRFATHALELRYIESELRHVLVDSRHHAPTHPFACSVGEHAHDHDHAPDDHDDHDDHDHDDHDEDDARRRATAAALERDEGSPRRRLTTGECAARPDKWIEVVAFNDYSRVETHGTDDVELNTASIFALVSEMYRASDGDALGTAAEGYGLYDASLFECDVRLRLAGQVSFTDGNPSSMVYAGSGSACSACGDSCSSDEVSASCLLSSFSSFALEDERDELEEILGVNYVRRRSIRKGRFL